MLKVPISDEVLEIADQWLRKRRMKYPPYVYWASDIVASK